MSHILGCLAEPSVSGFGAFRANTKIALALEVGQRTPTFCQALWCPSAGGLTNLGGRAQEYAESNTRSSSCNGSGV